MYLILLLLSDFCFHDKVPCVLLFVWNAFETCIINQSFQACIYMLKCRNRMEWDTKKLICVKILWWLRMSRIWSSSFVIALSHVIKLDHQNQSPSPTRIPLCQACSELILQSLMFSVEMNYSIVMEKMWKEYLFHLYISMTHCVLYCACCINAWLSSVFSIILS